MVIQPEPTKGIEVRVPHRLSKCVEEKTWLIVVVGFDVLDVDLTRSPLESVDDSTGSFRYLDGLHPGAGNKGEPVGSGKSSERGNVFYRKLAVDTGKSEQLHFSGSSDRIRIGNTYGRIGFKGFREIATGGPQ